MALRQKQSRLTYLTSFLIQWAFNHGYELTYGDAKAKDGHCKNSLHYSSLAVDFNLFKDGKYLTSTEDHKPLGDYWKTLDQMCTWGGDFKNRDGNHYSYGEGKVNG